MQHLEDGFLHELADGEVPSEELVAVREHLEACESCRARLDEARMEAETARELIELIEVPDGPTDRRTDGQAGGWADRRIGGGRPWVRPLAWAATIALAAGVGYYGRGAAPFAAPAAEPMSIGRVDTVSLKIDPPAVSQPANQAALDAASRVSPSRPAERESDALLRQNRVENAAGARADVASTSPRPAAPAPAQEPQKLAVSEPEKKALSDTAKLQFEEVVAAATGERKERSGEDARQRSANVSKDEAARRVAPGAAAAPPSALAETRLMAKSTEAPVVVTFPRAVELLGGRIKLIEGMVPSRLEAVGRTVRVIYVIDEGDLVLAQVSAPDSLNWNLAGPLSADSLARLRTRIK